MSMNIDINTNIKDIKFTTIISALASLFRIVSITAPVVITTLLFIPLAKANADSGSSSTVAASGVTVTSSTVADSSTFDTRSYYFGANANYNWPQYSQDGSNVDRLKIMDDAGNVVIKKSKPGFGVLFGTYLDEDISSEVGYSYITRSTGTNSAGQDVVGRMNNMYLDFLGYKPTSDKLDFIGVLGLGRMKPRVTLANNSFATDSDFNKARYGYRVGAGAQYRLVNNFNARTMLRYQRGKQTFLKSHVSASLDINYLFF